jgi:hypothetical protein
VTVGLARQRSTKADLLNPRTSEAAERNPEAATRRLAEHLAHALEVSRHEVTKPAQSGDSEAILVKLRESRARQDGA